MEVLSRSNPVLMIVEDVHWSDPTSLEAFGRAVDRIAGMVSFHRNAWRTRPSWPLLGRWRIGAWPDLAMGFTR
jgi:predicted ATPase